MNEEDYMEQLKIAGDFHGEICGGVTVGTKMAMYGLELMGMELKSVVTDKSDGKEILNRMKFDF